MTAQEGDQEKNMAAIVFAITTAFDLQSAYCGELNRLVKQGKTWEQIWKELGIEQDVSGTPSQGTQSHILKYMAYGYEKSSNLPRAPGFEGCVPREDLEERERRINTAHTDQQKADGEGFYGQTPQEREEYGLKGILASGHFPETLEEMAYIERLLDDSRYITSQGHTDVEAITAAVNIALFNGESVRTAHAMDKKIREIRRDRRSDPDDYDE